MTAEMLEALLALWAREAIPIKPGVNRRDRIKLMRIQIRFSIARKHQRLPPFAWSAIFSDA
jgi:hypothetical protein